MHPFSTNALVLWDSLRVVVIFGGLVLAGADVYIMTQSRLPARWLLMAGLLGFIASAIGTEYEHLGDHATYRLFANLFGVAVSLVGSWHARKEP